MDTATVTYTPGQLLAVPLACFLCGQPARRMRKACYAPAPGGEQPKEEAVAICAFCDDGKDLSFEPRVVWVRKR